MAMRACEACKGPGPCLWDTGGKNSGRYVCKGCHSTPGDVSFSLRPPAVQKPMKPSWLPSEEGQRVGRLVGAGAVLGGTWVACVYSLWMDYLGFDWWSAYCSDPDKWVSSTVTVPIAVLAMLASAGNVLWGIYQTALEDLRKGR